jgi:hypothetical protein
MFRCVQNPMRQFIVFKRFKKFSSSFRNYIQKTVVYKVSPKTADEWDSPECNKK